MCGISGFVHYDRTRTACCETLRRMSSALVHRGPDGQGLCVRDNWALGHQRLAIIDLSSGGQPMFNRDCSVGITFNGEIYNFLELRGELQSLGYDFRTHSDTEVLLYAYEHWGIGMHEHLNGMWAFALWDERTHQLLISRDRLGEKPLYYAEFDHSLIFGSECKAIMAYGLPREANLELLETYLTFGYVPSPFSFFKGTHKLAPGHFLLLKDGHLTKHKYWDLPEIEETKFASHRAEVDAQFEFLLRDSVRLRMRSDVPFGAFLSGGVGSAAIVALMAENGVSPINTFTIGFSERGFDERRLANAVAEKFCTSHHEFTVTIDSLEESVV